MMLMVTAFIWIEKTNIVWCGSSSLCPDGVLIVRIMKNGRCGRIMGS